ncbi:MAG: thiamine biosynthesis protein ThiS [[Chlorobium] sp. 445]|nr:MAG: thiamine biosynthesis protein ThiS [[Chlorobium] sp. 445]
MTNQITLNGKVLPIERELTVVEFLRQQNISPDEKGIAIAINEAVINRRAWERVRIKANDRVEIVHATQGG